MYALFTNDAVKKLYTADKINIDNVVFRLHYMVSVLVLASYSIISLIDSYAGDTIDCVQHDSNEDLQKYIDSYCYIHGTRSLKWPKTGELGTGDGDALGNIGHCQEGSDEECYTYHPHYQWVAFMIVIQAGIFYIPR